MTDSHRTLASLLIRVIVRDEQPGIVVQNLKTGEILEFGSWHDFVDYAQALPTARGLR